MKTAAVYDRWLYALGGGEQVAFSYASMLRDLGYKTTLLTHKQIDRQKAISKLNVDIKNIAITYLPPMSSPEMSGETEKYDVFVNTSYLDYFPNRSKFGILSVFFPGKIFLTPYEYLKRAAIVPGFQRFFIYPIMYEGFRFDEYKKGKIYKWLGVQSSILFNHDISNISLRLYLPTMAFSALEGVRFYLGDTEISPTQKRLLHTQNYVDFSFEFHGTNQKRLSIVFEPSAYTEQIALMSVTIKDIRFKAYNLFKKFFPTWEMRLHGGPGVTRRSDLLSYQKVVTISEFSKKWIERYWRIQSEIVYPSIRFADFKVARKKKTILHVGRFFVSGHNKKQMELAKAFVKVMQDPACKGWELHFVGSVHEGSQHQAYFEQVRTLCEGYPVVFHTNADSKELKNLLSEASIYWHATGLDQNEEREPILFEHFGITTVEAMASGCVPIVINAGGQKEIVTKDSGILWNTRQELIEATKRVMLEESYRKKLSDKARERAEAFDTHEALQRFSRILGIT